MTHLSNYFPTTNLAAELAPEQVLELAEDETEGARLEAELVMEVWALLKLAITDARTIFRRRLYSLFYFFQCSASRTQWDAWHADCIELTTDLSLALISKTKLQPPWTAWGAFSRKV